jgi:hypothetical protein
MGAKRVARYVATQTTLIRPDPAHLIHTQCPRCVAARLRGYDDSGHARLRITVTVAEQPDAYRPIFRTDDKDRVVACDWAVGFLLGLGLRPAEWGKHILLTGHRALLTPILVYGPASTDLLPEVATPEKRRRQAAAHEQIVGAIIAVRAICNPHRAAEAHRQPGKTRPSFRATR